MTFRERSRYGVVAVSLIFMHIHTSKKPVYLCTVPRLSQIHVSKVNQHKVSLLTIDVRTRKESSVFDSTWCLSFNKNEDRYTPLNYILIRNELESFIGPPINSLKCPCILAKCSWSLVVYDLFWLELKITGWVLFQSINSWKL